MYGRLGALTIHSPRAIAALVRLCAWPTNARVPSTGQGIDPHQMMMNASAMPTTEFADYSFVFVH